MANDKDFVVKNAVEVGGSTKTTLGSITNDDIDLSTGNYFAHTPVGATTYTISNAATNQSFQLEVTGGTEEVAQNFSTTLYTGNASSQTITNNIDLATDGGMVWVKRRDATNSHSLWDSARGINYWLSSDNTSAQIDYSTNAMQSFNTNGFTLGTDSVTNGSGNSMVSWAFKKAAGFFDVQTFTYTSGSATTINHNLNCEVGMVIIKRTDSTDNWYVQHRSNTGTDSTGILNGTAAFNSPNGYSNWIATFGTTSLTTVTNQVSGTYVAYLFAHDTASDGLIQCGSYTNNSSANVEINLGWTPQWVLVKNVSDAADWIILDNQRGLIDNPTTASSPELQANTTSAESNTRALIPTSTGFYVQSGVDARYNSGATTGTKTYIYMAIRSAADLDLTWPTSIEWAGGVAPAAPATGETDLFSISTDDGGTTYQGFKTADNLS